MPGSSVPDVVVVITPEEATVSSENYKSAPDYGQIKNIVTDIAQVLRERPALRDTYDQSCVVFSGFRDISEEVSHNLQAFLLQIGILDGDNLSVDDLCQKFINEVPLLQREVLIGEAFEFLHNISSQRKAQFTAPAERPEPAAAGEPAVLPAAVAGRPAAAAAQPPQLSEAQQRELAALAARQAGLNRRNPQHQQQKEQERAQATRALHEQRNRGGQLAGQSEARHTEFAADFAPSQHNVTAQDEVSRQAQQERNDRLVAEALQAAEEARHRAGVPAPAPQPQAAVPAQQQQAQDRQVAKATNPKDNSDKAKKARAIAGDY